MMKITQDLHVHTNLSLCAQKEATLRGYVEKAKQLGLDTLGIANHFWDPAIPGAVPWYQKQDYNHICELRADMAALAGEGIRILFGVEVEYCHGQRKIAITEEVAAGLDLIIVPNSHTHITMPRELYANYQKHADYMLQCYHDILNDPASKYVTAMAHPFSAVCCPYNAELLLPLISDAQFKECFEETASKHIAVEINTSIFSPKTPWAIRNSEYMRMFEIARDCGCQFTFGSDAHDLKTLYCLPSGSIVADCLKLTPQQIRVI